MRVLGIIDGLFLCAGIAAVVVLFVYAIHAAQPDNTAVKCKCAKCEAKR